MRIIVYLFIVTILVSCNKPTDFLKLLRTSNRIYNTSENTDNNSAETTQNPAGLCTLIKYDTVNKHGINYSVSLLMPVDTTNSIELTSRIVPMMIKNYADSISIMELHFISNGKEVTKKTAKYIETRPNVYERVSME